MKLVTASCARLGAPGVSAAAVSGKAGNMPSMLSATEANIIAIIATNSRYDGAGLAARAASLTPWLPIRQ